MPKVCALTISDIAKRFFTSDRKRHREENGGANFFDFVTLAAEESDKVENFRFLENRSKDFDENQAAWSLFDTFQAENIKKAKIKLKKIDFSKFRLFANVKPKKIANFQSRF